jgi:SAM-dependent methyltransferase
VSQSDVGRLYDALHAFEWRHKGRGAYPVHKKLRFDEPGMDDIYDWIVARIALPDRGRVLDAGCGVGFGALRLARIADCHVTGISLSAKEIARAREIAVRMGVADRVEFLCMSFDDLPPGAYDLVVAVESLKHSSNLTRTLRSIQRCLKPGGQLIVVEDVGKGILDVAVAEQLAADWALTSLYTENDYVAVLGSDRCMVVDLSSFVRIGAARRFSPRRAVLGLLLRFVRANRASALRAYRGGLHLERLYAEGRMAYKAILYRQPAPVLH